MLFAASRKSYLGRLLAGPDGVPRPVGEREAATIATSVLAFAAGVWGVRVHEVRATADALAVWRASGSPRLAGDTRLAGASRLAGETRLAGDAGLAGGTA